jgi:hypothetical protein
MRDVKGVPHDSLRPMCWIMWHVPDHVDHVARGMWHVQGTRASHSKETPLLAIRTICDLIATC